MIGYVTVGSNDIERARSFYDALFASIGVQRLMVIEDGRGFTMYGTAMNRPSLVVTRPYDGGTAAAGNGAMVALPMKSREEVDAFHSRALALGAADEGAPGLRGPEKLGYYFAYFRDPDGNKFAVYNIGSQS